MDLQLEEKTAFISGSTKGIGYAVARALAKEGARVMINGHTQQSVDEALAKLDDEEHLKSVTGFSCDFSKPSEIHKLIAKIGDVDILVNNVGIFENKNFQDISDDGWEEIFQINVMSGVRLSRAFLPGMLKKNWGRIIFISSESALNIPAEMIHYGMSKTAMLAVSRGLAKTTSGTDVTVNTVLPGPTLTQGIRKMAANHHSFADFEAGFFKEVRPSSILQRFTDPAEIANMVTYLASPLSSATNGASIRADGGVVDII